MREIASIEIVEDRTAQSRCDEGFLRVRRLLVRNRYADGSTSANYRCDIVSRPHPDAVALCLYKVEGVREIKVILKESPRVPIYPRKDRMLEVDEPGPYRTILELVAGMVEPGDGGRAGMRTRAARESIEEVGQEVEAGRVADLGEGTFASPGTSDEKVHFCSAPVESFSADEAAGDGTTMEEAMRATVLDLREAIRMCRDGRIPDMKTEVGLLRLADQLGYLPQLGCFRQELPPVLRERYDRLGAGKR